MSLVEDFKDRIPTQVLSNGAIRYEEFDENGNSLGYKYMKRADEPIEKGNVWNKVIYDGIKEEFYSTYRNIPQGLICMWSGVTVPTGWHLCDGTNGTPDLRDRFVVGSGNEYEIGNTGGEKTHKLTIAEMPSHSHTISNFPTDISGQERGQNSYGEYVTKETSSVGGNQAHENRPPYYALAFIMKA